MITLNLAKLANRKIIKITGPDCYPYLQGLLCNDLRFMYEPDRIPKREYAKVSPTVLSTFMLNAQGRAICDLILYRTPLTRFECQYTPPGKATEHDELLIECDSTLASGLANTLYGYRVRRKVQLAIQDNLNLYALFPDLDRHREDLIKLNIGASDLEGLKSTEVLTDDFTIVSDPRLTSLGMRIVTSENSFDKIKDKLHVFFRGSIVEVPQKSYTTHRYALGVGEGYKDHPESNCLPLECNADFLNSVNFDKGCYLGQELTARIHHTGVVRKRLMPMVIDPKTKTSELGSVPLIDNTDIIDAKTGKKVGIIRSVTKDRGLALLRHELAIGNENLIHHGSNTKLRTYRPYWWSEKTQ